MLLVLYRFDKKKDLIYFPASFELRAVGRPDGFLVAGCDSFSSYGRPAYRASCFGSTAEKGATFNYGYKQQQR